MCQRPEENPASLGGEKYPLAGVFIPATPDSEPLLPGLGGVPEFGDPRLSNPESRRGLGEEEKGGEDPPAGGEGE